MVKIIIEGRKRKKVFKSIRQMVKSTRGMVRVTRQMVKITIKNGKICLTNSKSYRINCKTYYQEQWRIRATKGKITKETVKNTRKYGKND